MQLACSWSRFHGLVACLVACFVCSVVTLACFVWAEAEQKHCQREVRFKFGKVPVTSIVMSASSRAAIHDDLVSPNLVPTDSTRWI